MVMLGPPLPQASDVLAEMVKRAEAGKSTAPVPALAELFSVGQLVRASVTGLSEGPQAGAPAHNAQCLVSGLQPPHGKRPGTSIMRLRCESLA